VRRKHQIERSGGGVIHYGPGSYGAVWRGEQLGLASTLAEARGILWNAPGGIVDELIHRQHVLLLQREMARVLARALRDEDHC
jgi:hypothetical protein